jgi:hypothetical protein
MRLALRSRHLGTLAVLLAGAPGCNLLLDIDRLDRGAGGEVEVIASVECNPGKIAVAGDQLYWTITGGGDNSCPNKPRNAIRRLAIGTSGPPVDVVTTNLDGQNGTGRPWQIAVAGDDLYWIGSAGKVCVAKAGGTDQACGPEPTLPPPCPSLSLRHAGNDLYLHAGDCAKGGEIQRYDTATQKTVTTGLSVSGNFLNEIDSSTAAPGWIAWIDVPGAACSQDSNARRVNVALPSVAGWSSCSSGFPARPVRDVAVDSERLYWIQVETNGSGSLYTLPLSESLSPAQKPALVVRDLTEPNALALDAQHIYITTLDRNGAVFYLPKDTSGVSKTPDEIGVLAENRDLPYDITADDPGWIYWLCAGTTHTVERARKPVE